MKARRLLPLIIKIPLDTQPLIAPFNDPPTPPTTIGPYDSSSPTSVGDLTKGDLMYIKDVETLALSASRSRNDLVADHQSPSLTPTAAVSSPPPFNLENFPPLPQSSSPHIASPSSPLTTPSFDDPSLLKSLDISMDKSPVSPYVLPLDSIRVDNVTIRKAKKGIKSSSQAPTGLYTPLSARIKTTARTHSTLQALRAKSPVSRVEP